MPHGKRPTAATVAGLRRARRRAGPAQRPAGAARQRPAGPAEHQPGPARRPERHQAAGASAAVAEDQWRQGNGRARGRLDRPAGRLLAAHPERPGGARPARDMLAWGACYACACLLPVPSGLAAREWAHGRASGRAREPLVGRKRPSGRARLLLHAVAFGSLTLGHAGQPAGPCMEPHRCLTGRLADLSGPGCEACSPLNVVWDPAS